MVAVNKYSSSSVAAGTSTTIGYAAASVWNAGDTVVVSVWSTSPVASVTDSQGNSYIPANLSGNNSQWVSAGATVPLITSQHITVTFTSSCMANATVTTITGAWYGGIDAASANSGTGTAWSVVTGPPTYAGTQVAIVTAASGAGTPTFAAGWTALSSAHGSSTEFINTAYQIITGQATAGGPVPSGAWSAVVLTLIVAPWTEGTAPLPPSQYAGQLATSSDMNAMAAAALWLRRPPMVLAQTNSSGTGQSMPSSGQAITFSSILRDTDGFFALSAPSHLTVPVNGIYKVRYSVPFTVANCQVWVRITTGSNNPAGAGVQSSWWYGWAGAGNGNDGCVCGGGVLPLPLYQGDYIQIFATPATTANMPVSPQPAIVSMRMVSV